MGRDLELRPEDQAVRGLLLAEKVFTPKRRTAIAQFLNVAPEDPALVPYLAACASYGLDPVMGQIWLIPQRVKVRVVNGDVVKSEYQERYRPAVGRDGFLSIARRDRRYGGLKGTTVCERDSFEVFYDGSEDEPKVLHRFSSKPTSFEEGANPGMWRGRILGAWAKSYAEGQPPMFYFAPVREHMKMREKWEGRGEGRHRVLDQNGRPVLEPDGAWEYVSTMIQKAAQSYVLRIMFGITGLVPADELVDPSRADGHGADSSVVEGFAEDEFDWSSLDAPESLIADLRAAVDRVNVLAPFTWPQAKLEMVLTGRSAAELEELASRIGAEAESIASHAARRAQATPAPAAPEPTREPEESVTDAEVVSEPSAEDLERAAILRKRIDAAEQLLGGYPDGTEDHATLADEIDGLRRELAAVENPSQPSLL